MNALETYIYKMVAREDCLLDDVVVSYDYYGRDIVAEAINYLIQNGYIDVYLEASSFGIDVRLKIIG